MSNRRRTTTPSRTGLAAAAILAVAGLARPAFADEKQRPASREPAQREQPAQRQPFADRRAPAPPPSQPFAARREQAPARTGFAAEPRREQPRPQPAPRPTPAPARVSEPRPAPQPPAARPQPARDGGSPRPAPSTRPTPPDRGNAADRPAPQPRPAPQRPSATPDRTGNAPERPGRPAPSFDTPRRPTPRPSDNTTRRERPGPRPAQPNPTSTGRPPARDGGSTPAIQIDSINRPRPAGPTYEQRPDAPSAQSTRPSPQLTARPVTLDPDRQARLLNRRDRLTTSFSNQPSPAIERSTGFSRHSGGRSNHDWNDDRRHDWGRKRDRDIDINISFNFYRGSYTRWYDPWPSHHCYAYDGYGVWWYYGPYRYYCPPSRFVFRTVVYTSAVYEHHYYYGLAHYGTRADRSPADVLSLVDQGWRSLECGDYRDARHRFAQAADASPDWGLPKIGYALAAAASGHEHSADRILRQALGRDPQALLEVPWSEQMESLLRTLDWNALRHTEHDPRDADAWVFVSAMRIALGDPDGAADAAFRAEAAGDTSQAVENLLDLLSGVETD